LVASAGVGLALAGWFGRDSALWAAEPMRSDDAAAWSRLVEDGDVQSMLDVQRAEIEKSMRSNGTFRRALKKLEGIGWMVAVVGNVQAYRTEGEAARKAVSLREAGKALAKAAADKNFEDAKSAAEAIAGYPDKIAPAEDASRAAWTDLIDLGAVMHGVSTIDSETKTAVAASKPADFKKSAAAAHGQAMLLACLSVVSRDYEDADDWRRWCDEMRDGSIRLAKAFGKKNLEESKAARDALLQSCKSCHDVYRPDEN
jgi:hypothetical protein